MNSYKITFNSRPKIEIVGDVDTTHLIEIYEYRDGVKEFVKDFTIRTNHFISYVREWYGDYHIDVYNFNNEKGLYKVYEHIYDDKFKKVLINLETKSLNESIVWFNCALEYKNIHDCELYIKSNHNDELKNNLVTFVNDVNDNDYYAIYNIGKYDTEYEWSGRFTEMLYNFVLTKNRTYCSFRNPRDWHNLSIDDVANDILGINKI